MTVGSDDLTNIKLLFYGPSYTYTQSFRSVVPTHLRENRRRDKHTPMRSAHPTLRII